MRQYIAIDKCQNGYLIRAESRRDAELICIECGITDVKIVSVSKYIDIVFDSKDIDGIVAEIIKVM